MKIHSHRLAFTKQDTIEFWDNVYDQNDFFGDCFRKRTEKALTWVNCSGLSNNLKILDVGCGAGRLVREVTEIGHTIFGMDYSYGMLSKANTISIEIKNGNSGFFQGNIETLPLKSSSFDIVICLGVITYLHSHDIALSELARLLTPGGVIILSFVNKAGLVRHLDLPYFLSALIQKISCSKVLGKRAFSLRKDSGSKSYFVPTIRRSLEHLGFSIIDSESITLDLWSFYGREIFPRAIGVRISRFFDRFSNVPIFGSLAGWSMIMAKKRSVDNHLLE